MNLTDLNKIARAMVAPGKGLLAADESGGTIKKRFDAIGVESTKTSRRDYREMMFRAKAAMTVTTARTGSAYARQPYRWTTAVRAQRSPSPSVLPAPTAARPIRTSA